MVSSNCMKMHSTIFHEALQLFHLFEMSIDPDDIIPSQGPNNWLDVSAMAWSHPNFMMSMTWLSSDQADVLFGAAETYPLIEEFQAQNSPSIRWLKSSIGCLPRSTARSEFQLQRKASRGWLDPEVIGDHPGMMMGRMTKITIVMMINHHFNIQMPVKWRF